MSKTTETGNGHIATLLSQCYLNDHLMQYLTAASEFPHFEWS